MKTLWSDINIELVKQQDGDVEKNTDVDAVKNSLLNILSTPMGSRRMKPDFAMPIQAFLFEPIDIVTANLLGTEMYRAISRWEDRIIVDNINVYPDADANEYNVTLTFRLKSSNKTEQVSFILSKI